LIRARFFARKKATKSLRESALRFGSSFRKERCRKTMWFSDEGGIGTAGSDLG